MHIEVLWPPAKFTPLRGASARVTNVHETEVVIPPSAQAIHDTIIPTGPRRRRRSGIRPLEENPMLNSIRRGFGFLKQAAGMAAKDPDLLKPSLYAMIAGGIATLILAVPILIVTLLAGDGTIGQIILAIMGFAVLFVQYAITYVFAGMTVRLVHDYLTQGDGRMDQAWATVRRDFFDILSLATVSALVKLVENMANSRRGRQRNAAASIAGVLASILNRVWTVATFFILPAMILEDLNLGQGVKRATQIIKDNLLLVAVTEIGVGSVVGLIGFVLFLIAAALGVGLFLLIGALANWSTAAILIGVGAGVLTAGVMIVAIQVLSSYVTTAYHTCLFIWARDVEQARTRGVADAQVAAPAPIAALVSV
jgi:hypothetical protein